jgi:hypothetical protein
MSLFIPITKVDVAKRLVYGTLTEEVPDKAGEILDYASARPAFETWSQQFEDASGGKSLGNVRAMHGRVAAGKFTDISFDDENKRISGVAKIIDDDEWQKVLEGVYTGFSIGGGYAKRWPDEQNPALVRYTPVLHEVSLVDNPAVPTATFDVVKMDGSVECRKFTMLTKDDVMAEEDDSDEQHVACLLNELAWLEEDVKGEEEEDEIMPHILALQQYLSDEEAEATVTEKLAKYTDFRSQLSSTIEALQERLKKLESQPMPAKGALRAVSKSDDRYFAGEEKSLDKLSNAERTNVLMKQALANPIML